jgi:hypothetical protein
MIKCPQCGNIEKFHETVVSTVTREINIVNGEKELSDFDIDYEPDDVSISMECDTCGFEGMPEIFDPKSTGPYIGKNRAGYYYVDFIPLGMFKSTELVFIDNNNGKYHKKEFEKRTKFARKLANEFIESSN